MGNSRTLGAETPSKDLLAPAMLDGRGRNVTRLPVSRSSGSPRGQMWPEGRVGCVFPFSRWAVLDFSAEYAVIMNSFLSIHVLG